MSKFAIRKTYSIILSITTKQLGLTLFSICPSHSILKIQKIANNGNYSRPTINKVNAHGSLSQERTLIEDKVS